MSFRRRHPRSCHTTAEELAGVLQRITGAEFAIEPGTEAKGITLGTLAQFPDADLQAPMAIRDTYDGVEAFAVRSDAGRVRLLGNTDLGAGHAAYRFLELLGCRWFFMGDNWEIVPETPTLSFALNEVDRPRIWSRNIWMAGLRRRGEEGDPDRPTLFRQWAKANRMARSLMEETRHVWGSIPDAYKLDGYPYKEEFASHPEYFALVDGKRRGPQFCVTNEGLQNVIHRYVDRHFELNPEADMVSLDPADTRFWCTCAECDKVGHYSSQPFYLANLAAKHLQKSHPGKTVGLLAYSWHADPPHFDLEPNVFVMLTAGMHASQYSSEELFELWAKKSDHLGMYEYFSYWESDHGMIPGGATQNRYDDLSARMQRYVDHNVIVVSAQASSNWGVNGLGYYLANRTMWNPAADTAALRGDFYHKAFGPAAPAMERYFERLNLSTLPFRGTTLLRQCIEDLEEASALAAGHPGVLTRIDDLKANMVYNYLGWKVQLPENEDAQKQDALEWFTWSYRTRNNHMTDWIQFRASVGNSEYKNTLAFKFQEHSWNYRKTEDNPWRVDEPVTSRELADRFEKIKEEWLQPPAYTEKTFSNDHVMVQTDGQGKAETRLWFTRTATLLFASKEGEPLRFKLDSIPSPNQKRKDAHYTLAALDGTEILSGDFPEGETDVELKVPGPAVYSFTCRRTGRGWTIDFADGLHAALLVDREVDLRPQNLTSYVYVPRGTGQITMHVQWGTVTVRDPDNEIAHRAQSKGELVAIPVPQGMDGKVWSVSGKWRNLWFLEIPTVLSCNPEMLFVPREVAEADGLQIVVP